MSPSDWTLLCFTLSEGLREEDKNSEDMLILPSLITAFSAVEKNIESCDVRWGSLCVYVHFGSSTDEISVETENLHTGQVERTRLSLSQVLSLFIICRQAQVFFSLVSDTDRWSARTN